MERTPSFVLNTLGKAYNVDTTHRASSADRMSFRSRQVRDVIEALGLEHYDAAAAEALLRQGVQPYTVTQVQNGLLAAKLPPASISDVLDVLDEVDADKQAKLAAKLRAKAATRPSPAAVSSVFLVLHLYAFQNDVVLWGLTRYPCHQKSQSPMTLCPTRCPLAWLW